MKRTYDSVVSDPPVSARDGDDFPAHIRDIRGCPLRVRRECFGEYLEVHCMVAKYIDEGGERRRMGR